MWRVFSKKKPKEKGWYMVTVEVENQQRYVMDLYWYPNIQKFIDNIRQNVCEVYTVTGINNERLYDIGQDRTDSVIAWKKLSKPYMKGFVKKGLTELQTDHMTFNQFTDWCNERACDGCWGRYEAVTCMSLIDKFNKTPIWKHKKLWEKYEQAILVEIVNPINDKIAEVALDRITRR